ncbi:hypothetical protein [Mesorhizobium sp. CO1-1-2]
MARPLALDPRLLIADEAVGLARGHDLGPA